LLPSSLSCLELIQPHARVRVGALSPEIWFNSAITLGLNFQLRSKATNKKFETPDRLFLASLIYYSNYTPYHPHLYPAYLFTSLPPPPEESNPHFYTNAAQLSLSSLNFNHDTQILITSPSLILVPVLITAMMNNRMNSPRQSISSVHPILPGSARDEGLKGSARELGDHRSVSSGENKTTATFGAQEDDNDMMGRMRNGVFGEFALLDYRASMI
jgi:hypothetical protein